MVKSFRRRPYPVNPPPFTRQTFTKDMVRIERRHHAAVVAKLESLDSNGMFTSPSLRGTVLFPGTDGGGEWGGAAFDPETTLLYVNSNEQPWIIRMVTHETKSLCQNNCAACHGDNRQGAPPNYPSLVEIGKRRSREHLIKFIREGEGRMPGFDYLGRNVDEIVDFLLTGRDAGVVDQNAAATDPNWLKYRNEGFILFRDPDNYPPIKPPWGTLNAIDLNQAEIRWQIPLGEYPELVAKRDERYGQR
jgi:quinoprotein glucose dehydrogenase